MKTLGRRLRTARKLRQLSQGALAKQIGTSPNQISMIENEQSGTSVRTIVAAASALNVSLDFLAGLSEEPRSARDLLYDLKAAHARDHRPGSRAARPCAIGVLHAHRGERY